MLVSGEFDLKHMKSMAVLALSLLAGQAGEAAAQGRSAVACDNYARAYANDGSRQGQMLRGGAVGSLLGLGIGSIAGAGGVGAAVGAGVGIIGGGMRRSATSDRMYNAAYNDCMARR